MLTILAVVTTVACVQDAPGVAVDAGDSDAMTSDPDAGTTGFGSSCADDSDCEPGQICRNLAGNQVCTASCSTNDGCLTGVCAGDTCWPAAEECGAGGLVVEDRCTYETSCAQLLARTPDLPSGHYVIEPGDSEVTAWCDMETHNGGLTIVRVAHEDLQGDARDYEQVCAELGLELIVPSTRGQLAAIRAYLGELPPVVGVYSNAEMADALHRYDGRCGVDRCTFFLSAGDSGTCENRTSLTADGGGPLRLVDSRCPFGTWTNSGDVAFGGEAICSTNDASIGPYRSCLERLDDDAVSNVSNEGITGVYGHQSADGDSYRAYCDMTSDGGGWTLAAKVDGMGNGAEYDASFWIDRALVEGSGTLEKVRSRTPAFSDIPFTHVRLVFDDSEATSSDVRLREERVLIPFSGESLQSVFASNAPETVNVERDAWLRVLPGASIQPNCGAGGFNLRNMAENHSVRLGILGDDDVDCSSPGSSLGVGISGSEGNESGYQAGNVGNQTPNTAPWAMIFVRETPLVDDCDALFANGITRSGTYPIDSTDGPVNRNCTIDF